MADAGTVSRGSRRAVVAAGIGTLIEGYDLLIYGYLASSLAGQFFPADDPTAALLNTFAIFALGFVVRPLGGVVFGHVGDRFGRRTALTTSILLMAIATLGIGVLPPYRTIGVAAPILLLICRLLQGFSIGGEYVGANIMVLEHSAMGRSGRTVSVNQVAAYLGAAAAAATSLLLASTLTPEQLAGWGWRLPFLAAVPLGLVGLYLRARVPESPALPAARDARPAFPLAVAARTAWRGMIIFAGWLTMITLGGFLVFGYMPTYLTRVVGLSAAAAFGANLVALGTLTVGAVAGGHLVDRYPPRRVAVVCATGVAVSVVPGFLLMQHGTVATAMVGQAVWAGWIGAGATVSALMSASQFPPVIRYTATGLAYNVTVALVGGTAPYVSTWLIARTHSPVIPAWYLVAMALVALTTAAVGLRSETTAGHRLPTATVATDRPERGTNP
jgi:MFS transporter, MHS family, proline/betaine transporter